MEEKKLIEVRCPCCKGLLFKIFNCLSGEKFVQIKCRKCREIVLVP